MDIKVITRHAPSNYGSLLQSIATITILEHMGHQCEIIDYIRKDEKGLKAILTSLNNKKGWNGSFIKKALFILFRYPEEKNAERKFERMRSQYLKLTQRCSTIEELSALKADVFLTGSDQVWGPTISGTYDEAYFLSFVRNVPKVAFAASFGRTDFNDSILSSYKKLLSTYQAIAVRENTAVDLLRQMDIPCAGQVLDPTLLLTGEEWGRFINKPSPLPERYVLVYQLHNNRALDEYAEKFAANVGLPLYRVSPTFHQFRRGGKFIYLPDLGEFLSAIKNCSYFITDSFHGTAFALNFNKQFMEILPNNKILKLTGLENRIVTDFEDFSIGDDNIDFAKVNQIVEHERNKSLKILRAIIDL